MTGTYDWLVVGAGFTGAVLAEQLASQAGKRVLVIDRRDHVGGNAHDCLDENGVLVHPYGPHIFHTNSERVLAYLDQFTEWRAYEHRVGAWIDGKLVPLPINLDSLDAVFGERETARITAMLVDEFGEGANVPILKMRSSQSADIRAVADFVYEKVFLHYTRKQWGMDPDQLDPAVSGRVPVRLSRDNRYFQDRFQAMPRDGYSKLFERLLDHELVEVRTGTAFADIEGSVGFDRMIYTGPIDSFFDNVHGPLPYRSMDFRFETAKSPELLQAFPVENFPTPAQEHPYTRCTEFRHLTGQRDVEFSTRVREFPQDHVPGLNEPHYPIPHDHSRALYARYAAEAKRLKSVIFAGRLADYSYYNMDQAVGRALSVFEKRMA